MWSLLATACDLTEEKELVYLTARMGTYLQAPGYGELLVDINEWDPAQLERFRSAKVVREMPGVREHLIRTTLPDGRQVRLPPAAVETGRAEFPLAPHYGEHTRKILDETGLDENAIDNLVREGVVR